MPNTPNYFRRIRRQMQNLIFHFDTRIPAARRIVCAIDLVDLYSNIVFGTRATTSELFFPHQCMLWTDPWLNSKQVSVNTRQPTAIGAISARYTRVLPAFAPIL